MFRRTFLAGALVVPTHGVAAEDAARRDAQVATIVVDGNQVTTMQTAADLGGAIRLSSGELRSLAGGAVIGAAHFRKPVWVIAEATRIIDQTIEGKGTFVVDANAAFSGLDISGATGDGIGAAFRHQSGDLTVRRTKIHHCENGLLGPAIYADCTLVVDDCDVFENGTGTGQTHGLYVGEIRAFTCTNSRFRATDIGHHIKSRARTTTIRDCRIGTDFFGNESYNVDVPQGGDVTLVRCHLRQGPHTDNNAMLNFGGERNPHPGGSLVVTGTAFESTIGGTGIRIHPNADVVATFQNCRFTGVDVPVDGNCTMKNCWYDGRPLPDGPRRRASAR